MSNHEAWKSAFWRDPNTTTTTLREKRKKKYEEEEEYKEWWYFVCALTTLLFFLFSHAKQNDIDLEKDSQSDCWCRARFYDGSRECKRPESYHR